MEQKNTLPDWFDEFRRCCCWQKAQVLFHFPEFCTKKFGTCNSWMTKHDKDAGFALNSCGQIAKTCVALRSCDENHFCSLKFLLEIFSFVLQSRVVALR